MHRAFSTASVLALLAVTLPAAASEHIEHKAPPKGVVPPNAAVPVFTLVEVSEHEPNDRPGEAQEILCGTTVRPAEITNAAATRDTDWVAFTASAGDLITLTTAADQKRPTVDTLLGLIAADGTTVLARDDDSGPGLYSAIASFCAPYSGRYFAAVRGFRGAQGAYRLDVACAPGPGSPPNDQCAGAIEIPCGVVDLSGNSLCAADDVSVGVAITDPSSCTGSHSPGRDVFFRIEVTSPGERIDVLYQIAPQQSDASIYLVSDCADVSGTCLAGQDAPSGTPAERLAYTFPQAGTFYLVLDAFNLAGGAWTLSGARTCLATPAHKLSWGRLKTVYR